MYPQCLAFLLPEIVSPLEEAPKVWMPNQAAGIP
ncbi:uncharacterized protein J3R85_001453 [Psidium guajava]|nr:uncharacterized protein J3R85_001453 [Psidium guajava]